MSDEITPAFVGDVRLLRWQDNHMGQSVTFELDGQTTPHPFRGMGCGNQNGQMFKLVAVMIDGDGNAISATQVGTSAQVGTEAKSINVNGQGATGAKSETPSAKKPSNIAAIKAHDPSFQLWFWPILKREYPEARGLEGSMTTDDALKIYLGIISKKELDTPGPAQDAFNKLLASYDAYSRYGINA